jgi:dihydroorotate dehydrogenase
VYQRLLFPATGRCDAERMHEAVLALLAGASHTPALRHTLARLFAYDHPALAVERLGLRFRGPLGLAAGFDKNAVAVPALAALGSGTSRWAP